MAVPLVLGLCAPVTVWPLFKVRVRVRVRVGVGVSHNPNPNQVWPLFKWNIDYIVIGYLARETQVVAMVP